MNDIINLTINFFGDTPGPGPTPPDPPGPTPTPDPTIDPTSSAYLTQTFDPSLFLTILVSALFVVSLIFLVKKLRKSKSSSTGFKKFMKKSNVSLACAVLIFGATSTALLSQNVAALDDTQTSYEAAQVAFDATPENSNITPDKTEIKAVVNDDGTITMDTCTLTNSSDQEYKIAQVIVNVSKDAPEQDAVKESTLKIKGCDGTVYEDKPSGTAYIPKDLSMITGKTAEELTFEIADLEDQKVLDKLKGNPVYTIDLTLATNEVKYYTATVDLNKGTTESKIRKDWTKQSDGTYTKDFVEGTNIETILYDWDNVELTKPGYLFDDWSYTGTTLDASKTITASYEMKDTLEDYDWNELKFVANDISTNDEDSEYYEMFVSFAEDAQTKIVPLRHNFEDEQEYGYEDYLYVRIIGINHDTVAGKNATAGLTFAAINSVNKGFAYDELATTNASNWAKSSIKKELETNGEIYERIMALNPDLKTNIATVTKTYSTAFGNENTPGVYDPTPLTSNDSLFLLSYNELGGVAPSHSKSSNDITWGTEGTPYEYIANDPWLELTSWHAKGADGELIFPGPVINRMNFLGVSALTDGKHKSILQLAIEAAVPALDNLFGFVMYNYENNLYTMQRTVCPEDSTKILCLNDYGNPDNESNLGYNETSCVSPAFCL